MVILHCISKEKWENVKNCFSFGKENIEQEQFIHCSSIEYFWRVAPNFKNTTKELVLLCIDTDKLKSQIKWEDGDNCGREYPHVYGEINTSAVIDVLPFKTDTQGNWIKNIEFNEFENK